MKRLSFKALAAAVATTVLLFTTVVSAAPTTFKYQWKDQQGPVWTFEGNGGSGWVSQKLAKVAAWDNWVGWAFVEHPDVDGVYANIDKSDEGVIALHPDKKDGKPVDVAVAWKAPADGKLTIPATTVKHSGENDPDTAKGTKVWVEYKGTKHNEKAIPFNGSVQLPQLVLDVKAGDKVYFVANNNGRGGNNGTQWSGVTLSFEESAPAANNNTNTNTETPANPETGDVGTIPYAVTAIAALAGIVAARKRR